MCDAGPEPHADHQQHRERRRRRNVDLSVDDVADGRERRYGNLDHLAQPDRRQDRHMHPEQDRDQHQRSAGAAHRRSDSGDHPDGHERAPREPAHLATTRRGTTQRVQRRADDEYRDQDFQRMGRHPACRGRSDEGPGHRTECQPSGVAPSQRALTRVLDRPHTAGEEVGDHRTRDGHVNRHPSDIRQRGHDKDAADPDRPDQEPDQQSDGKQHHDDRCAHSRRSANPARRNATIEPAASTGERICPRRAVGPAAPVGLEAVRHEPAGFPPWHCICARFVV